MSLILCAKVNVSLIECYFTREKNLSISLIIVIVLIIIIVMVTNIVEEVEFESILSK